MKNIKYFVLPLIILNLFGCNDNTISSSTQDIVNQEGITPYHQEVSESGKAILLNRKEVPQIILSSLLRTDLFINADFKNASEMEDYFAIAKETNMNTIELSIMWSQIEKSYDNYDYTDLKCYLDFAKKYDF